MTTQRSTSSAPQKEISMPNGAISHMPASNGATPKEESSAVSSDATPKTAPAQAAVVETIAIDDVSTHMLVRDRFPGDDEELDCLAKSIAELGLSNPIRVLRRPGGDGVELIQGYRRLSAYRALLEATGDAQWARIPALVLTGVADIGGLYRRMVDENVIRKDLSFAEMARAAQTYAMDPQTDADDLAEAVAVLFQSAPYSKRSYIRSFAFLLDQIGDFLAYPTEVPRALGVTLARALKDRPEVRDRIRDDLENWDMRGVLDELDVLRRHAGQDSIDEGGEPDLMTKQYDPDQPKAPGRSQTKTTFEVSSIAGRIKCTAGVGRLDLRVKRDFTIIERKRLERAIAALIDNLT